ncbi:MAG: glycerol kinase GlpK [Planctomycetota bacterium]
MTHVMAIDQGTTSCRAIVFDASCTVRAIAQRDFEQVFPRPGWVEHDPELIWSTQAGVMAEALARAGLRRADIAAVGITNQRETAVVWDRATGTPIANAIVWQDRRTADACARFQAQGAEPMITERTGLLLDAYFSATKIAWLLDNVPGARARAERGELAFGTIDSWLVWKLTNGRVHTTDATNASRTMLFDIHRMAWDAELCELFGVPMAMLPDITPTSGVVAEISAGIGLDGVPIASLVGDQQAALAGQRCTRPGLAKNTYGTGCFMLVNTGDEPKFSAHRLLTTVAWQTGNARSYALEGSVFVAGALVQWLRDGLGIIERASDIEALAASVPDSGGVVVVPALTGLGAPHWDPAARGAILGLTRGTTGAHIARAALEGIAFQVADLFAAMRADAAVPITELRVDGGAARNDLLMQTQADLLGVPVIRPANTESTAFGAALLAAAAVGAWPGFDQAPEPKTERRFVPSGAGDPARLDRWREAIGRSRGWPGS